ncbi:LysR family transcriptional regulator [Kitasatospora sp. NPDC056184]|uniref:LysR family transcriptional regulator n=1 Tax=Kitasatospora sp. NPDC056184 TaxID=3345738 RepID=UPI0035DD345C
MFDSRHIRTFHEVVRAGSYSAAARELGYTQPAITQQMKALERTVGLPLFTRAGRGLRLTEAGEALARHAEQILGSLSAAQQQLAALGRLRAGRVRVCAFPSANATLIPEAMARLLAEHPGVRVELLEAEPPDSVQRLLRGECDIALAFRYPGAPAEVPEELDEIPLMEDLLTVLLPVGHPLGRRHAVRLADLDSERWIAGCPRCRANLLQVCAEQGFAPDIVFSTDDNLAVQSLVAAGVGIALMPALVLSFMCHRKVTGRAVEPHLRRQVSAYVLREHRGIPATALVLDHLRQAAAARVGC